MPVYSGRFSYDSFGENFEKFEKRRDELKQIILEVLNNHDFKPMIIPKDQHPNSGFESLLINFIEESRGNQRYSGLYFFDLGKKIPGQLLTRVMEDFELSEEIFQKRFYVRVTNIGSPSFFAIKL